jgi:putative flippase GtrA
MAAFLRFLLVGGSGFLVDAGLTMLLLRLGQQPWQARLPALLAAMLFTWWANRRFTYQVRRSGSAAEAGRYVVVAAVVATGNYGLFLLLVAVGLPALLALVLATTAQTLVSFMAYRHFVFRRAAP